MFVRISIILVMSAFANVAIAGEAAPTFKADIVPVLQKRCVSCHMTGDEPGELALTPKRAYASLVGVNATETTMVRIKPGTPDQSYLVRKVEGTHQAAGGSGERMPFGEQALDAATLAKIRAWIKAGAKND